jgi:hypothetical protein
MLCFSFFSLCHPAFNLSRSEHVSFFSPPIFDAMFSRHDFIPLPMLQRSKLRFSFLLWAGLWGVFNSSGLDLGVTLSSPRISRLEFAKGSLALFHRSFFFPLCTIQYLALRVARNVPTSRGARYWKWSRPFWDSVVFIPTCLIISLELLQGDYSF